MKRVDFHLHTIKSDGIHHFTEVLTFLKDANVTDCAVTDHDTVINTVKYKVRAQKHGIRLIPATEISTTGKSILQPDMHILGYGISNAEKMEDVFNEYKAQNQEICEAVILKLREMGLEIDLGDVKLVQTGCYTTKRDIARCVVAHGYASSNKEVYDVFMGRGQPAYIPVIKMPVEDAIELIKNCGGIAVLAHPGKLPDGTNYVSLLATLKELGIKGIETLNACHSDEEVKLFSAYAERFSLVETCGTDFHRITTDRTPGFDVEDDFIRPFYKLLGL